MAKLLLCMPFLALALCGCTARTAAPAAVSGTPHSATLTWNASTSPVLGYHIYRATDPNAPPSLLAATAPDVTQYVDRTVEPGRTYYYSVKSFGANGVESPFSENVSATIPTE